MRTYPSEREIARLKLPGRYAAGDGVYLQISEWQTKSWLFRYFKNGKAHHMGLGSATYVTLAEARQKGYEARRLLIAGGDPLEAKRNAKAERIKTAVGSKTFSQCANEYIAAHEAGWRNGASSKQWRQSLRDHVFPKLGSLPVDKIDTPEVLAVLEAIWTTKPETANRIRGRIENILNWAGARKLRSGENPARWRGHLENLLPKHKDVKRVEHFKAVPPEKRIARLRAVRG